MNMETTSPLAPDSEYILPNALTAFAARLLQTARSNGWHLATAESCTGGRIASTFTAVAGSSDCYMGGVVAYQNSIKSSLLLVPTTLLDRHGAVSEPVALAMATGARQTLNADWAVATTGIAGPGGATPTKPVGLVWIAVAGPTGATAFQHFFSGTREQIQSASVYMALSHLETALQNT